MAATEALSEYELVLMLDPEIPDERRDQIATDARQRIETGATLKHDSAWGMRKLAYEIKQRTEADYRFFRFETDGGVLDALNHNLRIADGVLRFRIFKVDPAAPTIVPPAPAPTSARGPRRPGGRGEGAPAQAPPASEQGEAAPAEAPAAVPAATSEGPPPETPEESAVEAPAEPEPAADEPDDEAPAAEAEAPEGGGDAPDEPQPAS